MIFSSFSFIFSGRSKNINFLCHIWKRRPNYWKVFCFKQNCKEFTRFHWWEISKSTLGKKCSTRRLNASWNCCLELNKDFSTSHFRNILTVQKFGGGGGHYKVNTQKNRGVVHAPRPPIFHHFCLSHCKCLGGRKKIWLIPQKSIRCSVYLSEAPAVDGPTMKVCDDLGIWFHGLGLH